MNGVMQAAVAGILAAVCAMVVRRQVPELALLLAICAGVLILLSCSGALSAVIGLLEKLAEMSGLGSEVIVPMMKVTGIAIITRLSSDFCKDAKEGALASAVETAGSIFGLVTVIPLMTAVLQMLSELL